MTQKKPTMGYSAGGGRWGIVLVVLCLVLVAVPAHALLVSINLGWGYNQNAGGNDLGVYNLQVGSIIQVVMYDRSTASAPGPDANDNFDIFGNYPANPDNLSDTTIYDPESTPAGHVIAYTTEIKQAEYLDGNGNVWWNVYVEFTVIGAYDALYLRVFDMTAFPDGTPASSYWGLSDVRYGTNLIGTWPVGFIDDTYATNRNYFEVIPEPGVMALLALGSVGLLAGARRRKNSRRVEGDTPA